MRFSFSSAGQFKSTRQFEVVVGIHCLHPRYHDKAIMQGFSCKVSKQSCWTLNTFTVDSHTCVGTSCTCIPPDSLIFGLPARAPLKSSIMVMHRRAW